MCNYLSDHTTWLSSRCMVPWVVKLECPWVHGYFVTFARHSKVYRCVTSPLIKVSDFDPLIYEFHRVNETATNNSFTLSGITMLCITGICGVYVCI